MTVEPRFDVIVPIHNSFHVARLCLSSLKQTSPADEVRITCVLDACDDHTVAAVRAWSDGQRNSRVIQFSHNLGFVGASNVGLEVATGDYAVLVNSDTCATQDWTSLFKACFMSDERIGIASPLSNFCPHNSVPIPPGLTLREMATAAATRQAHYPDLTTCEGFFFAIRRRALDEFGFLDGIFGQGYCEELDLSLRANYFGWRTVLVDNCYIFHFGRESFGSATRAMQYEKNKHIFFDRWRRRYASDFKQMKTLDAIGEIRKSLDGGDRFQAVKWV